ncbi:hypothetical protein [Pedobacter hartonius]|uniref:Uncharacterized protein n=1 Tax=Pedobacter hartonius TaxID=425514 RepID=A0A1H4F6H8_9SPHI|nr:hypothetical protein [Pedobacter hartonius]SEA92520.1 hypothetical protein SAMN05443550_10720 [Pedobacter hartonius]
MEELPLDKIIKIWHSRPSDLVIKTGFDEIEFVFENESSKSSYEELLVQGGFIIKNNGTKFLTINDIHESMSLYVSLESLLDDLNQDINKMDRYNLFVFNVDDHYLYYDFHKKEVITDSQNITVKNTIKHFEQYNKLLKLFLTESNNIFEINRPTKTGNELVIVSKGQEKMIASFSYKFIDVSIFNYEFSPISFNELNLKLGIEEWLAVLKNNLCQYLELQSDNKKTFSSIYNNLNYIFNQTQKDYQLYISRFSFDRIRKQFKTEKNNYFESLSAAQDKISGQIISVPISLGASIYSFYQFKSSLLIIGIIYVAICIYSLFIGFVVVMNLYDIKKVADDVNEEMGKMKLHFEDLYNELKKDFDYMRYKRIRIRVLAWSIIAALIITLFSITMFLFNYQDPINNIFKFL